MDADSVELVLFSVVCQDMTLVLLMRKWDVNCLFLTAQRKSEGCGSLNPID